ncbi:MAG TPA: hypothetical protein VF577_03245, partial [Allosphingosinicella sp.]
ALTGASGGALGAFFSIAVGLRSRTVLVDIQKWDNRRDAVLRIVVGTIGGAILICLFLTKLVSALTITSATFTAPEGVGSLTTLVVGFLAGFSERAVPDILAKASLATDAATGEGASDVATDQARAAASGPDSHNVGATAVPVAAAVVAATSGTDAQAENRTDTARTGDERLENDDAPGAPDFAPDDLAAPEPIETSGPAAVDPSDGAGPDSPDTDVPGQTVLEERP